MTNRIFALLTLLFLITGCKTELYGGLSEKEGNEMFAILYNAGLSIEKETDKDRFVTLLVEEEQSASAIQILKNNGFPKDRFTNIGDVFSKDGLISSPTEEKARLIYALSQEISSTLSQIDGVLTARVHVVMSEKNEYNRKSAPPSASVFIKHIESVDIVSLTGKIKSLVANSINGLTDKQVTVALFPALKNSEKRAELNSSSIITWIILSLILLALLSIGAWLGYQHYIKNKQDELATNPENGQTA